MLFSLTDNDSLFITLTDKSMINNRIILMVPEIFVMAFKTARAKAAKEANYASGKHI